MDHLIIAHVSPESPDAAAAAALHEIFAVLLRRQESIHHEGDLGGVLYTPCQITVILTFAVVDDGIAKAALYTILAGLCAADQVSCAVCYLL